MRLEPIYEEARNANALGYMLYGKAGDTNLYADPDCTEKVALTKDVVEDFFMNGLMVSYDGAVAHTTSMKETADGKVSVIFTTDGTTPITLSSQVNPPSVIVSGTPDTIDLLGKRASALQSDVKVRDNDISAKLYYVKDYTGFSSIKEEQSGYYLATTYTPSDENADVYVYKTNGTVGEKKLGKPDLTLVSRITNPDVQKLIVRAEQDGVKGETIVYNLTGLCLMPEDVTPPADPESDSEEEDSMDEL